MSETKKLRVICKRDLMTMGDSKDKTNPNHKSVPYNIPIVKDGERFITGQNLSYKQMIGEEPMNEEQKKLYPFIINPDKIYKIKHLTWLSKEDPYQKCMIDLLLSTGKWADSKITYDENPVKYDGYFEDPISEAVQQNTFKDNRYDAESCIRTAPIDSYSRIALMLNFLAPDVNINVSLAKDLVLKALYDVCDTRPEIVKKCFAKFNQGVDKDIFLLECMHHNIIQRKENGDIWLQNDYIGKTLDDLKRFLGKKGNEQLYSKFQAELDVVTGKTVTNLKMSASSGNNVDKDIVTIMECKSAIVDGDYDKAVLYHGKINRDLYKEDYDRLGTKISEMNQQRSASKSNVEKEEFIKSFQEVEIGEIQKKIAHHKSKFKEEDCKEFWSDKSKLIEYMAKVKFGE